jgi:hypothetical protein
MPLRQRILDLTAASSTVIGNFQLQDFSKKNADKNPSPVTQNVGGGEYRLTVDELHGRPPYQTGGPFFSLKRMLTSQYIAGHASIVGKRITVGRTGLPEPLKGDWHNTYSGGFIVSQQSGYTNLGSAQTVTGPDTYDDQVNPNDLSSLGNRAYNRLRPKVGKLNLFQTLVESRDIPRMLRTTAKGFSQTWEGMKLASDVGRGASRERNVRMGQYLRAAPKRVADQFLNTTFGWTPFVRDVHGILDVAINFDEHVERATRNNGRWQRRRFTEDEISSDNLVYANNGGTNSLGVTPVLSGTDFVVPGSQKYEVRAQTGTRIWYEGSFATYSPEFDPGVKRFSPFVRECRQALSLLGANVDATSVYKVTPWTWLIDWGVNVGDFVRRVEDIATDAAVSRYFYLMRRTFVRFEYRSVFSTYDGQTHDFRAYRSVDVKRRVASVNPFNFSLLPGGLSGMQYSILAALGLSKLG